MAACVSYEEEQGGLALESAFHRSTVIALKGIHFAPSQLDHYVVRAWMDDARDGGIAI